MTCPPRCNLFSQTESLPWQGGACGGRHLSSVMLVIILIIIIIIVTACISINTEQCVAFLVQLLKRQCRNCPLRWYFRLCLLLRFSTWCGATLQPASLSPIGST